MIRTPVYNFDPENVEHMNDFIKFYKTKSLSSCKYRYALEGNYGDIVSMMTDKFLNHIISKNYTSFTNNVA